MASLVTPVLAYGTVLLDLLFVYVLVAFIFRKTWGSHVVEWMGKKAIVLGFVAASVAFVGSLVYSQVIGYEPCELCWWQRICLYPLVPIFGIAWRRKDRSVFHYALPLAFAASLIALYHTYIQLGGESSVLPCTAVGGACTKVYVLMFDYVTIPTMSMTIAVWVILLAFIHRYHEDRHA